MDILINNNLEVNTSLVDRGFSNLRDSVQATITNTDGSITDITDSVDFSVCDNKYIIAKVPEKFKNLVVSFNSRKAKFFTKIEGDTDIQFFARTGKAYFETNPEGFFILPKYQYKMCLADDIFNPPSILNNPIVNKDKDNFFASMLVFFFVERATTYFNKDLSDISLGNNQSVILYSRMDDPKPKVQPSLDSIQVNIFPIRINDILVTINTFSDVWVGNKFNVIYGGRNV